MIVCFLLFFDLRYLVFEKKKIIIIITLALFIFILVIVILPNL